MESNPRDLLSPEELLREKFRQAVAVCSHVARCKILNCSHRQPHPTLTCPIMGRPRRNLLFTPMDDECPLNLTDLGCLPLETLVVVHEEQSL